MICMYPLVKVKVFLLVGEIKGRLRCSLEKEMVTHSSTLAWKIPWTEEPGRLHAVHGVAEVRHD